MSEVGSGSVRVSWDSVAGADMYTVTLSEVVGDNQKGPCHQRSSNNPISIDSFSPSVVVGERKEDELRPYTTYSITVVTTSGSSNSSQQSVFTTKQKGNGK